MISDSEIRQVRREHGRDAIPWNLQHRVEIIDREDRENSAAFVEASGALGGLIGALIVPVLLIYFLPVIGVYLLLAAGAFAWATMMFWWPRYASSLLAILTMAGLLYGIGSEAQIKVLWFEIGSIVSRDLPMWNGPGTWALAPIAAGPAIIIISMLLTRSGLVPPPYFIDENYVSRDARGLCRHLPFSILVTPTCLLPLIVFLPVILWAGMFGEFGFWPGAELTRGEVLQVLMDRPLQIFKAGFHPGIFWPGGFFASIGMIGIYIALGLSLIMSLFYCYMRRDEERDCRQMVRKAKREEKLKKASVV